jgi:hypothetical protein
MCDAEEGEQWNGQQKALFSHELEFFKKSQNNKKK